MDTAKTAHFANAQGGRHRRRMIPVVDARFQWKYTLIITALGVGITAVMGGFLYKAHRDNTRLLDLDGNVALQEQVMRNDQIFLLYLIVLVVVMALALAFWGLVVTHRISGPLHIVARYLTTLAEGRYPDLRPLRRRDELHEFFSTFEEAIGTLRQRDVRTLRALSEALEAAEKDDEADVKLNTLVTVIGDYRDQLAEALGKEERG